MNSHTPKKRFGQNFLIDPEVIHSIITAINPHKTETLVEIGPGLGAITQPLLTQTEQLFVIELDRSLIPRLEELALRHPTLKIFQQDALTFDFSRLRSDPTKLRIVGNLPYNISTPLLFHLLSFAEDIQDMHFMLQKEVVDRICARSGDRNFGRLSVMLQNQCTTEKLFDISPQAFNPPPKVMSSIVRLTPRPQPITSVQYQEAFKTVVQTAFSQPRKTLRNTLKNLIDIKTLDHFNLDSGARPAEISIEEYARLAEYLYETNGPEKPL